jgi:hypothetical protein
MIGDRIGEIRCVPAPTINSTQNTSFPPTTQSSMVSLNTSFAPTTLNTTQSSALNTSFTPATLNTTQGSDMNTSFVPASLNSTQSSIVPPQKIVHSFSSDEPLLSSNPITGKIPSKSVSNGSVSTHGKKPLKFTDAVRMHDTLSACKSTV